MSKILFPFTSSRSRRQQRHGQRNFYTPFRPLSLFHNVKNIESRDPKVRMSSSPPSTSNYSHFPISRYLSINPTQSLSHAMSSFSSQLARSFGGVCNTLQGHVVINSLVGGDQDENENDVPITAAGGDESSTQNMQDDRKGGDAESGPGIRGSNAEKRKGAKKRAKKKTNNNEGEGLHESKEGIYFKDGKLFSGGIPAMWNPENLSGPWLYVPTTLGFTFDQTSKAFVGKIHLKNLSPLFITYKVVPTTPNAFILRPREGLLSPGHKEEVLISTRKTAHPPLGNHPGNYNTLLEDLLSTGFYILATPVYFSSQLTQRKIKILWKAYGTALFPVDSAETHRISGMIPEEGVAGVGVRRTAIMEDYSMIGQSALGNYTGLRKNLPSLKTMLKRRQRKRLTLQEEEEEVMSEMDFVDSWIPPVVGRDHTKILVDHLRYMTRSVIRIREDLDTAQTVTRLTAFTILAFCLGFFILRYNTIIKAHGPNGVWVQEKR